MLRETLLRLKDTGVSVLDTEFLRFEPEHPIGIPEGFLEVSARLGAKHVLVMSAEPEEARTLERFGELCDRAAQYGLPVGPGVRGLHGGPHARPRRADGGPVEAGERVGGGGRAPLQPVGRAARSHRAGGSGALPLRADLRRVGRHARPHRYAEPDPRGAHRPVAARRGRAAAPRAGGGAARRVSRWRSRRPSRATADLPALERAQRAYRALSALAWLADLDQLQGLAARALDHHRPRVAERGRAPRGSGRPRRAAWRPTRRDR